MPTSLEFRDHPTAAPTSSKSPATLHVYITNNMQAFYARRGMCAYFSPSWTAFQVDRGRRFSLIVDDCGARG